MRMIRIGLASVDTTVGAVKKNTDKAIELALKLDAAQCTIGVFNEQLFGGYPAEDLVLSSTFLSAQWSALQRFAEATHMCRTVFIVGLAIGSGHGSYNASAVVCRGKVVGIVPKERLPSYGVFDERRVFTAGVPGLYEEIRMQYNVEQDMRERGSVTYSVPFGDLIFEFPFGTLATCTCEDTWTPDGPLTRRAEALVHAVPNASPARQGVVGTRGQMLPTRSTDNECVIAAAYQVGGNDSLIFDGGGYVIQNGQIIGEAPLFQEGVFIYDVDLARTERMRNQNTTWRARQEHIQTQKETFRRIKVDSGPGYLCGAPTREFAERFSFLPAKKSEKNDAIDYMVESMINGLQSYFEKTGAFKKILIALSGGKDSCLTLMVAWLYARRYVMRFEPKERSAKIRELITCVSMPTRFNSETTRSIARELCEELGVTFIEQSIEDELALEVSKIKNMIGRDPDVKTVGNIQARIRGERTLNLSNMLQALVLQTGNMSEKAVGYTTFGGDLLGGFSLIGNMPKTVVGETIARIADVYDIAVAYKLLQTRASAELAEGQFDEDELMPFPVLDLSFLLFAGENYSPADMYRIMRARWTDDELKAMAPTYAPGMLKNWIERFVRLFRQSIFKWVQAPQAVHLGSLDLDRERALQLPVVTSAEWLESSLEEMRKL